MAIGDLLFGLMGQPNPQQQLAQAFGQYPGQAGSRSGPVPGPGAGAAAPGLAQAGGGANVGAPPPQAQQQQQAPPQPQAYQTPPDLGQMYMNLMQRQQANAQINTGLGLLAGAFSHNQQDRNNMISAMSDLNARAPNVGEQIGSLAQLQQTMWQRQLMLQQMQHLPEIAKQLNITPEMAGGLFASGKLGDVMQNIAQSQYQQGTPEYKANVAKAIADTNLSTANIGKVAPEIAGTQATTAKTQAETGAIPATVAKTQAETAAIPATVAKTQAETAAIPATVAKTQAETAAIPSDVALKQAQTKEALARAQAPTADLQNYNFAVQQFAADPSNVGKPVPSFTDWQAQQVGLKEAATQTNLLQTQQKMSAQAALPDATDKIVTQLKLADEISANAHLGNLTGPWGAHMGKMAAGMGIGQSDLQAKIDQLAGSAGVSAVESLKGVGRILGTEFAAGTEAQSRLHDQQVSAKQYQGAIQDYRDKLAAQLRNVYQKAGMPIPPELDAQLKGPVQKLSDDELMKKYLK